MTLRLTFGIDPGLSGAVATLLDGEAGPFLDMPTMEDGKWSEVDAAKLASWMRDLRRQHVGAYVSACIEKVGARPNDGGTSAFRFGESTGRAKAVLETLGIPYSRAIPAVWKRHYGLIDTAKDEARLLAIRRFPSVEQELRRKKDIGRADALLIALWHETTQLHGVRAA
jgi:crossover junction endodeoxyribonuclease RuvC